MRREVTELVLRMARDNTAWGYDRIAGALNNPVTAFRTRRLAIFYDALASHPLRNVRPQMKWADFIRSHMAVLAGTDFFTIEVLTWSGLATYYVLFFLHLETRRVTLAGIARHGTEQWMVQMARNA